MWRVSFDVYVSKHTHTSLIHIVSINILVLDLGMNGFNLNRCSFPCKCNPLDVICMIDTSFRFQTPQFAHNSIMTAHTSSQPCSELQLLTHAELISIHHKMKLTLYESCLYFGGVDSKIPKLAQIMPSNKS